MIAVLSATEHDFYAMPLPLAVYSWAKLGVFSIVFVPSGDKPKLALAKKYCSELAVFFEFECEEKRIPTYSQVSRLFGAAVGLWNHGGDNDTLITADSDICVFGDYFSKVRGDGIHVIGADLTPADQYPMCFIAMAASVWKEVMGINKGYQAHLSELIDPIEGIDIRGEQWSYDQWYIKKKIDESGLPVYLHNRAKEGTQFASKRADRDGWNFDPFDLVDAHLPRPLIDIDNFNKVYDLFKIKYPIDDLQWMQDYYNEYKLL